VAPGPDGAAAQPQPPAWPSPPPAPPEAASIFGPATGLAERYAALLAGPGVERGLIGPRETARLWDRHLLNCAAVAELIPGPGLVIDLGSGAGLPGIVLAMLLPEAEIVLLEPMARRASFLDDCVAQLGLGNTRVCRRRAEEAAGRLAGDVVTARAVAPLERLAVLALGLARPGGLVLALKGVSAEQEVERARPVLDRLGARDVAIVQAGSGRVSPPPTVVRFTAAAATADHPPGGARRRPGGARRRPGGARRR
jgi:16S rRNA (guanine527-N7)-methyltransferase